MKYKQVIILLRNQNKSSLTGPHASWKIPWNLPESFTCQTQSLHQIRPIYGTTGHFDIRCGGRIFGWTSANTSIRRFRRCESSPIRRDLVRQFRWAVRKGLRVETAQTELHMANADVTHASVSPRLTLESWEALSCFRLISPVISNKSTSTFNNIREDHDISVLLNKKASSFSEIPTDSF